MKRNFKLIIEYDGTPYSGWQVQKDKPSVQAEIQAALSTILNQEIRINGSGRTDAGVHALGQVANFIADTSLRSSDLKRGLNSLIKGPVVIRECDEVNLDFHARFNARSKQYHYYILNRNDPAAVGRNYLWHIHNNLDIDTMQTCCQLIIGVHDFKSFEGSGSPRTSTVREIFVARLDPMEKNKLVFKVEANGFLRYMVRNIVGTLVQAGLNKITPEQFQTILNARDRNRSGATAPPQGLFLMNVNY